MSPAPHHIPDPLFSALASGSGGEQACRLLTRAQYSNTLLLIRGLLDAATETGHPDQPLARAAYDLLSDLQQPPQQGGSPTPTHTQPSAAVEAVLRHPAVTAWAWHTYRACHPTTNHTSEGLHPGARTPEGLHSGDHIPEGLHSGDRTPEGRHPGDRTPEGRHPNNRTPEQELRSGGSASEERLRSGGGALEQEVRSGGRVSEEGLDFGSSASAEGLRSGGGALEQGLRSGGHVSREGSQSGVPHPAVALGQAGSRSGVLRGLARPGRLAAVAAAAGIRSGRDFAIEVPIEDGGVLLPSLGRAVLPSTSHSPTPSTSHSPTPSTAHNTTSDATLGATPSAAYEAAHIASNSPADGASHSASSSASSSAADGAAHSSTHGASHVAAHSASRGDTHGAAHSTADGAAYSASHGTSHSASDGAGHSASRSAAHGAVPTALVRSRHGVAEVLAGGDRVTIPRDPHQDAPGWQAIRRLSATSDGRTLTLLVDDLDPFRMPGARLTTARLTEREFLRWRELLNEAWRLLLAHHRTTAEELAVTIRVLTPLVTAPGDQISSSSRETFGSVALSTPSDATSFALTFAHELQHAKLTSLLDITPLITRDDGRRYFAPWRDDPRPLGGLLQGTYAYLAVAGFWRRQRHHEAGAAAATEAATEFWRWRTAADETAQVIAGSGQLTERGRFFVERMARTLRDWRDEPVPAAAITAARERAGRHRALWESRHGTP